MNNNMYKFSYLMDYYPESVKAPSAEQAKDRDTVQAFMTGDVSTELLMRIESKVRELVNDKHINMVCFAPGTTRAKTILRFGDMAERLSASLPCPVFLDGVTLKFDSDPITHTRYYQCNKDRVNGRNVLLIGGVYTTGQALLEVGDLLVENGAKSVYGFFVAKTVI